MAKKCTKITPENLIKHGFVAFQAKNGICYIKGSIAVTYYNVIWVACSIIYDTIYYQRIYFNSLEEIESFV